MTNIPAQAIERVLRNELDRFGLSHVEANSGFDHDGDPALFITAVLERNVPLIPGDVSAGAGVALAEALRDIGDDRIPYLYIRHPDDERPEAEAAIPSP